MRSICDDTWGRVALGLLLAFGALAGCDDEPDGEGVDAAQPDEGQADMAPGPDMGQPEPDMGQTGPDMGQPPGDAGCDPLQPGTCAMPWPSDLYLVTDEARATGYTLDFPEGALPASLTAGSIVPDPWRRLDGYGLGTPILALFPEVEPTQLPDETRIADSLAEDAAALLFAVGEDGLTRVPYYIDLDAQAADETQRIAIMRPAVILAPDTTYIVAYRGLQTTAGDAIPPSEAFAALLAGGAEGPLAERQARFDEMFTRLEAAGVARDSLTLAWPFHTASTEALTGRLLHMVDEGLATVGEDGPELVIDEIDRYSPDPDNAEGLEYNPYIAYRFKGHFRAPHYMQQSEVVLDKQGWIFNLGEDGLPEQNGWREDVTWYATVPYSALDGTPHGLINHGHGMFGDAKDAADLGWTRDCGRYPPRECGWFHGRVDQNHRFITYAVDLIGMSDYDRDENALTILSDISIFTWIADRLHQGLLEYVLVTRAMQRRFTALPEVAELGVTLAEGESYYWGISQGAIFGATFLSISPDVSRGALGVAGANYATLLERSRNFEPFFAILGGVYTTRADQLIAISLMQLLWDGTDSISYYRHLNDPLPGRAPAQALVDVALGDYQVPLLSMETVGRSDVGVPIMANYDDQRSVPLATEQAYPHVGSGIVNWHFGNTWPAPGNRPPEDAEELGDPHESTRHMDAHSEQMAHFFRTGEIIDVCGGGTCPDLSQIPQDDAPAE